MKIGQRDMQDQGQRVSIPNEFDSLDESYFSLGQDQAYYSTLSQLDPDFVDQILLGLRDVVRLPELFESSRSEKVMDESLLRFVSPVTVTGQFARLLSSGSRVEEYGFAYRAPTLDAQAAPMSLEFSVVPGSSPPTNVHVLIGRNSAGKTYLLNGMARALYGNPDSEHAGHFEMLRGRDDDGIFAGVVLVTFSAFDPFEPFIEGKSSKSGLRYSYVGLKSNDEDDADIYRPIRVERMAEDFAKSMVACSKGSKRDRWLKAITTLCADPGFAEAKLDDLMQESSLSALKERSQRAFGDLSAGHMIVLLAVTRLVEAVEERTLVLFDEPECHLHPPLLSALVRALSELLRQQNGVAILATHSPIVAQEAPSSCVLKVQRMGSSQRVDRPKLQTFGEGVGVLTHEIFGLEVLKSGFHEMLVQAVDSGDDYQSVLARFDGELGAEGRAIARFLIQARDSQVDGSGDA